MANVSFRDAVLAGLQNRKAKQNFNKISEETGISVGWLKMFSSGKIENAGWQNMHKLYEYLAGEKLPFKTNF